MKKEFGIKWRNRGSMVKNNLMIVCHPDDETLFGGGEILQNPDTYTVICLDYGDDPIRSKEFERAMELLEVQEYEHWDGKEYKNDITYNTDILIPKLKNILYSKKWDKVVTHNRYGEYGHYRHIHLHNIIKELHPGNLYTFNINRLPIIPSPIQVKKRDILKKAYPSQKEILKWFDPDRESIILER